MRRGTSGINALIAVNKPCGMTSHDVVSRVRRGVGEKRVGHAGTLDPDASGVLVIGIGQGTRLMGHLTAERKSYLARITFGSQTATDDAEGEVVRTAEVPEWAFVEERVREELSKLVGAHMQVPPAYSAISVNGVRSYTRARAGQAIELEPRPITIFASELIGIEEGFADSGIREVSWLCSFEVSKGTYIRSIARDLGTQYNSAAHISALCRTSSGKVSIKDCLSLDEVEQLGSQVVSRALDPVVALGLPVRELSESELSDVSCGKHIALAPRDELAELASIDEHGSVSMVREGKLYGIWQRLGSRLECCVNFPAGIEGVGL